MGNWNGSTAIRSWCGVGVSGTPGRVTRLRLSADTLRGTLPPQLGGLEKLEWLHLGWNQLTGPISDGQPGMGPWRRPRIL